MARRNEYLQTSENPEGGAKAEQSVSAEQSEDAEQSEITQEAKNMAMLCHLLGLVGFLGPLIFWLIKKDEHKFINEAGREALNFQLSLLICFAIVCFTVVGVVLIPALVVLNIIFVIVAAAKTSDGKPYRYPIAIRFVK